MRRFSLFVPLACAAVGCAAPAVRWPLREGWRREVIHFPLDFAPAIAHRGIEEIRFAPQFFDAKAPTYWSYVFAWALDDDAPLDRAGIERNLVAYFRGLDEAVGGAKHQTFAATRYQARLEGDGPWHGTVDAYDPFTTGAPLTLHVRVEPQRCVAPKQLLAVTASPRPEDDPVWRELEETRATLACRR